MTEVTPTEVICEAASDAVLDGLLMVFHTERSNGGRGAATHGQSPLPRLPPPCPACPAQWLCMHSPPMLWPPCGLSLAHEMHAACAAVAPPVPAAGPPLFSTRCLPRTFCPFCAESLSNLQNDLPALTDFDKQAITTLCRRAQRHGRQKWHGNSGRSRLHLPASLSGPFL